MAEYFLRNGKDIADAYGTILASYATKESVDKRDNNNDNRSVFQRDRDRIIHSHAFRRLMYKTQVFVNHEGDHFRTRLTHTLEVSQLARGICKSLALNEDLAEAVALGHDLGHTPFGHVVERFFDQMLSTRDMGRFYHNEQSVRVVEVLESRRTGEAGLDLSSEVREGILKHNKDRSGVFPYLNPNAVCSHLEGQIVQAVDTIAYVCHDFEDAVMAGIVFAACKKNHDFAEKLKEMVSIIESLAGETGIVTCEPHSDTFFTRKLIHKLILDLTDNTYKNIERAGLQEHGDIVNHEQLAVLSESKEKHFKRLKTLIYENIYNSQTVTLMDDKASDVVTYMFDKFTSKPHLLPPEWLYKYNHIHDKGAYDSDNSEMVNNEVRVICDYISCMTDRFALEEHERLSNPRVKL